MKRVIQLSEHSKNMDILIPTAVLLYTKNEELSLIFHQQTKYTSHYEKEHVDIN